MRKEIYMGHGLYKQVEEQEKADKEADEVLTGQAFSGLPFSSYQTYSEQMQDELEPIIHPTQFDESDDLEAAKVVTEQHNELSKPKEKWEIVKLPSGGYIRQPITKEKILEGPEKNFESRKTMLYKDMIQLALFQSVTKKEDKDD
jgi:hypothetical protein